MQRCVRVFACVWAPARERRRAGERAELAGILQSLVQPGYLFFLPLLDRKMFLWGVSKFLQRTKQHKESGEVRERCQARAKQASNNNKNNNINNNNNNNSRPKKISCRRVVYVCPPRCYTNHIFMYENLPLLFSLSFDPTKIADFNL